MACGSCSTGGGCGTKKKDGSSGCGGGCSTGGCNKMNVYDWLQDMPVALPHQRFPYVEVRFKGGRKEFFKNTNILDLITGDAVVVETGTGGYHVGHVSLSGELVRLQMAKKAVKEDSPEVKLIYRLATQKDIEKLQESANRELPTLFRTRQLVEEFKLKMKLSDVEFQADGTKATFYYSADDRIDFRELIKAIAAEFKVKVEMRQISLRQEAGRLGGIGTCGRELCCSTWLTDFKSVTTSAARYQNLSLNPIKLSGQCGRLKCCLNYELDTYLRELKDIPKVEKPLLTEKGDAHLRKTDIFKKILWFGYNDETTWHPISPTRVRQIQELNKAGKKAIALTEEEEIALQNQLEAINQPLNEGLNELDRKFSLKEKERKALAKQQQKKAKDAKDKTIQAKSGNPVSAEIKPQLNPNKSKNTGPNEQRSPQGNKQNRPTQNQPQQHKNRPENTGQAQIKPNQPPQEGGTPKHGRPHPRRQNNPQAGAPQGEAVKSQEGNNVAPKQVADTAKPIKVSAPKPSLLTDGNDLLSLIGANSTPPENSSHEEKKEFHKKKFNKHRPKPKNKEEGSEN